jgi:hypothetical protein
MHKSRVALACMAAVLTMALLIPLVGCGGGGSTVPCKVSSVSGDVQVLRSGSTESVKATEGMGLAVGDTITTGGDGSANLNFFDSSLMEIKANSEILVNELSTASAGSTVVRLKQQIGRTINRVAKLLDSSSRYEVDTPAANTLVRGTVFELLVLQNGDTTVNAEQDSVSFTASGVTVTVSQGFQSSASVGSTPSTPQPNIMPQELIGVWKSDCGVHVGNQYRTIAWTLTDSTVQMAYDIWDSDSSCGNPSKKFSDAVATWQTDLVTRNTDGSYQVTATLISDTHTEWAAGIPWAEDVNAYGYNDWQVGVGKDVLGRIREPGAQAVPNKGTQVDLLFKVDGGKLSIQVLKSDWIDLKWPLNGTIFTK